MHPYATVRTYYYAAMHRVGSLMSTHYYYYKYLRLNGVGYHMNEGAAAVVAVDTEDEWKKKKRIEEIKCQTGWYLRSTEDGAHHNRRIGRITSDDNKKRKTNKSFDRLAVAIFSINKLSCVPCSCVLPPPLSLSFPFPFLFSFSFSFSLPLSQCLFYIAFIELIFMSLRSNWMMIIQTKIDFVHNNLFSAIPLLFELRQCTARARLYSVCMHVDVVSMRASISLWRANACAHTHTLFVFGSFGFIWNDEILFPFDRFRGHKATKMFRRSLDDRRRLHTIIAIKLIRYGFFLGLAQDRLK